MTTSTRKCPTCRKTFAETDSRWLPFCSDRCRSIDLGRWLTEAYSFPSTRDPEDDESSEREEEEHD